ncbi:hypothetical protein JMF89_05530 [Clostridiaceae bacterium UIB06]|uniref:F5/8 type C domain-containing protein n=1 Tax=Clostridium thailandense TaxID=2794346 RepID=A0A949U2V6_9CLOT|nr:discoidin domain-containing protein [Clostridium thailandense]MBV7275458.1 hypothetical protein [Clostridium thailandense]MCH5136681.1 hypothetical protein [Clostridiaceae bacterium UIB06]
MADSTINLGLVKPSDNEIADIQVINKNMDKIDTVVIAKLLEAKGYTDDKIAQLINSSPEAMDTLKELADAMGDDPNFRTTILNMLSSKANSSDLTSLLQDYITHKADNASESKASHMQIATQAEVTNGTGATKAVSPAYLKTELNKKLNITDYNPHDPDNGRYQSDFGFENAVYDSINSLSNNQFSLFSDNPVTTKQKAGNGNTQLLRGIGSECWGQRLPSSIVSSIKSINYVELELTGTIYDSSLPITMEIYNVTKSTLLATVTNSTPLATGYIRFTLSTPIRLTSTDTIDIRFRIVSGISGTAVCNLNGSGSNDGLLGYAITSSNTWGTITEQSSYTLSIKINTGGNSILSGTVTKTYTPSDLKRWGNAKWTQTTVASGSSIVCDVLPLNSQPNAIPAMISNTAPSGIASASSIYNSTYDAYHAFDGTVSGTSFWVTTSLTGWLRYQFALSKKIIKYSIQNQYVARAPKNWTFQGSNDGSTWTTLDTQTNISWSSDSAELTFNINNSSSYTYYQINITANNGDSSYLSVQKFKIYEAEIKLKSNVTSIADLSDIDITQYQSLNVKWTLTRVNTTDTSPTVGNPSVTWEGKLGDDGGLIKIMKDITIPSDTSQLDINVPTGYTYYKVLIENLRTDQTSAGQLYVRFNNDTGANYNGGANQIQSSASAVALSTDAVGSSFLLDVVNILSSNPKIVYLTGGKPSLTAISNYTEYWGNTSANISTISLLMSTGKLKAGATIKVWGCK